MRVDGVTAAWIALAVVTRLVAAILLGDRFHFIDEAIYVDAARALLAGNGYGDRYANVPAHPVFLALLAAPWSQSVVLLRCAQAIVTGVLGGVVLYALGTRTVGVHATWVALALWALDPLVVVAGALLYPEAIAAVVLAAALLAAVVAARAGRAPAALLAGVLLGMTILFRPVAAILIPVLVLWILLTATTPLAHRARRAAAMVAACLLTVAPWVLSNLAHGGGVVPAGMAGLQDAPFERRDINRDGLASSLGRAVWSEPFRMVRRTSRELVRFWELYPTRLQTDSLKGREDMHRLDERLPNDHSFPPTLRDLVSAVTFGAELAFAIAGAVIGWRTRRGIVVLFVAVAFFYGLGYALFVAKLRYRIVVLPGIFLLAGFAAATVAQTLRRPAAGR